MEVDISLPRKEKPDERVAVPIYGLALDGIRLAGFPGEIFSETTMAVKQAEAGQPVMVCSYADASDRGYVPVREAYAEGGYEVDTSEFAEGAEELVRKGLVELLAKLT